MTTVLIAGGGPAALEAALALRATVAAPLGVTLVSPDPAWAYRPLTVLEPFAAGRPRAYPLDVLAEHDVRVIRDAVLRVDVPRRIAVTEAGDELAYDALLVATGAAYRMARPGATSALDTRALHGLVQDVEGGYYRRVAFVAGHEAGWTLPLYELALQLAERVGDSCLDRVRLSLHTYEARPLEAFGTSGSELGERLLEEAGIELLAGDDAPGADAQRIVALPAPVGRVPGGLPVTATGFVPVDAHGRVAGAPGVYAAGDVADHPLKQGGLATQQADVAAAAIAGDAGLRSPVDAFDPVLRGVLLTGSRSYYLRRAPGDPRGSVSEQALWWPPTKVAGRYLSAFLDGLDERLGHDREERDRGRPEGVRTRAVITPR